MNTNGDPEGLVQHGNERVLRARFNDARFFWDVDQQEEAGGSRCRSGEGHVSGQARIYLEKTNRVVALVKQLGGDAHAQRAALLCKVRSDHRDGEGVHRSAGHRRRPVRAGARRTRSGCASDLRPLQAAQHGGRDSVDTREGQILALADKLDTLRECFRVGMVPTGSKDPFALRRAAQGVVKILVEGKFSSEFDGMSPSCANSCSTASEYYFREVRGFKYDEVNAVHGRRLDRSASISKSGCSASQASAPDTRFRTAGGQLQAHQEHSEAGGVSPAARAR